MTTETRTVVSTLLSACEAVIAWSYPEYQLGPGCCRLCDPYETLDLAGSHEDTCPMPEIEAAIEEARNDA